MVGKSIRVNPEFSLVLDVIVRPNSRYQSAKSDATLKRPDSQTITKYQMHYSVLGTLEE